MAEQSIHSGRCAVRPEIGGESKANMWRPSETGRLAPEAVPFDKAFAVYLTSSEGVSRGIARSISDVGMFIETREPLAVGEELTVSFTSPYTGDELTVSARVRSRFVAALPVEDEDVAGDVSDVGEPHGLSGMGVNFLDENGEEVARSRRRSLSLSWSCRAVPFESPFSVN